MAKLVKNIWGFDPSHGDPCENGKLLFQYHESGRADYWTDRHKYIKKRIVERERRARIRKERAERCADFTKKWLAIGCENPKCRYHRNGFLALEDAKKTHPHISDYDELRQYEFIIKLFEWNHIDRDKKTNTISAYLREYYRVKHNPEKEAKHRQIIEKELENCEQLCITCHRLDTHIEQHFLKRQSFYSTYEEMIYEKYGNEEWFDADKLTEWKKLNDKLLGNYDENQDLIKIFNLTD